MKPRLNLRERPASTTTETAYACQRATNATFTRTLQTLPVQAWADGLIHWWDDFADLTTNPPQSFYRPRYAPCPIAKPRTP